MDNKSSNHGTINQDNHQLGHGTVELNGMVRDEMMSEAIKELLGDLSALFKGKTKEKKMVKKVKNIELFGNNILKTFEHNFRAEVIDGLKDELKDCEEELAQVTKENELTTEIWQHFTTITNNMDGFEKTSKKVGVEMKKRTFLVDQENRLKTLQNVLNEGKESISTIQTSLDATIKRFKLIL